MAGKVDLKPRRPSTVIAKSEHRASVSQWQNENYCICVPDFKREVWKIIEEFEEQGLQSEGEQEHMYVVACRPIGRSKMLGMVNGRIYIKECTVPLGRQFRWSESDLFLYITEETSAY